MNLNNKKVLLVGLGILGGGVSMAKFLLKNGANLTITDLRTKKELKGSLGSLKDKKIKFTLGRHAIRDFKDAEIIIFNPAVSYFSPWTKIAKKYNKEFYNDFTLFLKSLEEQNPEANYIGITGTRGKTTTATWLSRIIPGATLGGNIPEKGLQNIKINSKDFILELSSFQLEYFHKGLKPPKIAIITNFYNDHLNRYGTMAKYFNVKSRIFLSQTKNDYLILNADDEYTKKFLAKKPKGQVYLFSLKKLPQNKNGLYFKGQKIIFQEFGKIQNITKVLSLADHEKANLLPSMLAAHLYGIGWPQIAGKIKALPNVNFRQEVVKNTKKWKVINDSAGTSPDATVAAIEKFSSYPNFILITGGTDKSLDFSKLAKKIKQCVKAKDMYLFEGTATDKLVGELNKLKYFEKADGQIFTNLSEIVKEISEHQNGTVVFSPASASFGKFKNEFDRGRKFNNLVKRYLGACSKSHRKNKEETDLSVEIS